MATLTGKQGRQDLYKTTSLRLLRACRRVNLLLPTDLWIQVTPPLSLVSGSSHDGGTRIQSTNQAPGHRPSDSLTVWSQGENQQRVDVTQMGAASLPVLSEGSLHSSTRDLQGRQSVYYNNPVALWEDVQDMNSWHNKFVDAATLYQAMIDEGDSLFELLERKIDHLDDTATAFTS